MSSSEGEAMSSAIATPMNIRVGEKDFVLTQLCPKDFAEAENYLRSIRFTAYLEATRMVRMPDPVRAEAQAAIITKAVDLSDVLDSYDGKLYLVWLSLKREAPSMAFVWLKDSLESHVIDQLADVIFHITGLKRVDEVGNEAGDDENPTTSTTPQVKTFEGGPTSSDS